MSPIRRFFCVFLLFFSTTLAIETRVCPLGYRYNTEQNGSCEVCPPGTFNSPESNQYHCEVCISGYFQSKAGQQTCIPCPWGSYSFNGALSCMKCPNGEVPIHVLSVQSGTLNFTIGDSQISFLCGVCPPGKGYSPFSLDCFECPRDIYTDQAGISGCLPCPRNSYSKRGSAKCTHCNENQALLQNGSCGTCPAGHNYNPEGRKCNPCGSNSFMNVQNILNACYNCATNAFSALAAAECITCPMNHFYIKSSKSYESCPLGFSYDEIDMECVECSFNTFDGRRRRQFSYGDVRSTQCDTCPPGSFSRRGSSSCFPCEKGMVYIADKDECGTCSKEELYSWIRAKCEQYTFVDSNSSEEFLEEGKEAPVERTRFQEMRSFIRTAI